MAYDYKRELKNYYYQKVQPELVNIEKINYLAVRGKGDPNQSDSEYFQSIELLYGVAYTIKMSHKSNYHIDGFFNYVVPPLEGLWWQNGIQGVDYGHKEEFEFISLIRLPDFVEAKDVEWAIQTVSQKKKKDYSKVEFFTYEEGLCVQCLHIGPYHTEPETVQKMTQYAKQQGYYTDINDHRFHHEIYLSDPRKTKPAQLKTVLRHPIRKI